MGVLRIVDLAGCESSKKMNNRGQIVFVPKRSSVSLQMLLKCLATMFPASVRSVGPGNVQGKAAQLSVSTFHFCQLTVLLKDHFFAKNPGNVVLIHTVANESRDLDAEARALFSLLPILPKKEEVLVTEGEEGCVLCPACFKKREILEEQIREKVVKVGGIFGIPEIGGFEKEENGFDDCYSEIGAFFGDSEHGWNRGNVET